MPRPLSLTDIICNALNKDYSLEEAAIDLGELINERALIRRRYGTGPARLAELERIIPLQEKLALGRLRGDEFVAQLRQFGIRLERHD
jgi:hypothetical protein